ncbi:hypothetical protein PGN77_12055 [Klebsiella aerogenes]
MSIYSNIQQKLTEYRTQQELYWNDLERRINFFSPELVSYLGVDGLDLRDREDKKHQIVIVGLKEGNHVQRFPPFRFEKIEGKQKSLHFYVQVNLSAYGSEILDCAMIFECYFSRTGSDYTINISGKDVECAKNNELTDFTKVFEFIVSKLEELVDKSRYE